MDVSNMNFPERIFAVGGAGKAIALTLLESDWIIDDLLKPSRNPESVTVTVIDTAEGEKNSDRQRIQDIRDHIANREEELRDADKGRTGTITVEYKLITEDLHLSGSIDLLGDEAVPRITAGNGMPEENWWIKERHINENLDFAKGVVRKRGLGKAIYYKAYAEDDDISSYIDLPQKGKVAMLVGLGGGTGSGIVMDLARHVQKKQRTAEVTLFGVLPNHTEGRKESTNAFAALSELEYSALQNNQLFKDRIVVPIDPTNFDGKTGNRIRTDRLLNELDEAILYLILSYYNTEGLEDPFAGTPQYAPFTVGIPQVLRYNIKALNEARDRLRELLTTKEEALQEEERIYDQIEALFDDQYNLEAIDEDTPLRNVDRTDLRERLENAESWLEFELFHDLGYESIDILAGIVEEGKEDGDDIIDQIGIITGSIRAFGSWNQETGSFVDDIDESLSEVIRTELELLGRRKRILRDRQAIDDSRIREAIEYLIGNGDTSTTPGVKLQRLESSLEDFQDELETLSSRREETVEKLDSEQRERSDEVERRVTNWIQTVEDDIETLQQIDMNEVRSVLSSLDAHLDQFVHAVTAAKTLEEVESAPDDAVYQEIDRLSEVLDAAEVNVNRTVSEISDSIEKLKRAKKAFINLHQEKKMFEKLTPWKSNTQESQEQARQDYRIQKTSLNDGGIFQLSPRTNEFSVTITYDSADLFEQYYQKKETLKDRIVTDITERLEDVNEDNIGALEATLEKRTPNVDDLRHVARDLFGREIGDIDELEAKKQEFDSQIADAEEKIDAHERAIELFQKLNNRREEWMSKQESITHQFNEHKEQTAKQVSTQHEDHVYVKNIQPTDIFRATGHDDIASSDLLNSDEERQRVRTNLEHFARNAQNQKYTGLYRRKISQGRSRYSGMKVRIAAMSPAIDDLGPETLDFRSTFQDAFDLGASGKRVESPYASWRNDAGGPWDIGLSVFVTGVFLDNIRKVVQPDGYYTGYQYRAEELEEDILIHHSHELETGHYVRRLGYLNLEDENDVQFYLRDEKPIVNDLLEQHIERQDI